MINQQYTLALVTTGFHVIGSFMMTALGILTCHFLLRSAAGGGF